MVLELGAPKTRQGQSRRFPSSAKANTITELVGYMEELRKGQSTHFLSCRNPG